MKNNHSKILLNAVREYDSFLDSLRVVADMGCGTGEDIAWWATLETRDDPHEPYNYNCFAVDHDTSKLKQVPALDNIHKKCEDFSTVRFPVTVDLMLAHDSLQYSYNPLDTLRHWNSQMTADGMLLLSVPTHSGVANNRFYSRSHSGCYIHYHPVNLIYMLAVCGFDCKDAYLLKKFGDPWINMAVYKSNVAPMEPSKTGWYDLVDAELLHPTVKNSVNRYGYLRQEDILYPWLDRENYYIDYQTEKTVIPEEAGTPSEHGVKNQEIKKEHSTIKQPPHRVKETLLRDPVGILRPPKKDA